MSQEDRAARGEALEKAVLAFEAKFERVDDRYMHTGSSRTIEDVRFVKLYPGSPDITQPVSFSDNYVVCAETWLADVLAFVARRPEATILFWRRRPHFVTMESGGLTIESAFVAMIPADISDATKQRWADEVAAAVDQTLAAEAPAELPAPKKGGRKALKVVPSEPAVVADVVTIEEPVVVAETPVDAPVEGDPQ